MTKAEGMTVRILGKEYMVACAEEERSALQASADYLDKKMREIRDTGKVIGTDRIAVMAALNITYELLQNNDTPAAPQSTTASKAGERIRNLQNRIEEALYRSRQLEI
ncbi:MAG: cell division protein ZapA [Gammaproteobacteria bacterium]